MKKSQYLSGILVAFFLLFFCMVTEAQTMQIEKPLPQKNCFCPPLDEIFNEVQKRLTESTEDNKPVLLTEEDLLRIQQDKFKVIQRRDDEMIPETKKSLSQ